MKLHKEGFATMALGTMAYAMFNLGMWRMFAIVSPVTHWVLFGVSTLLLFLIFFFFRVKTNITPLDTTKIVSPAYGTVVNIDTIFEEEYYKDERIILSIFLSPFDIHCQYVPMNGEVKYFEYHDGKYLVAFHPKSSELNEHASLVIENEHISILVKQIAGAVARRIVPYLQTPGQQVVQNQELGYIKFGSRVDLFFPLGTKLDVKVGDKVIGCKTVIADLIQ